MSLRRSSGEVINATLLEVFLAFVFVVLALATFEQHRTTSVQNELDSVRIAAQALADSLAIARAERDAIREQFASQFPPMCDSGAVLLNVRVVSATEWSITVRRSAYGLTQGSENSYSPMQFTNALRPILAVGRHRHCKFQIGIVGTAGVGTDEYITARRTLVQLFYPRDAYERGNPP